MDVPLSLFHRGIVVALAALLLHTAGCRQVSTDQYAIGGHEVSALLGPKGSGKSLEVGGASAADVRHKLGEPLVRYENDSTDIFEAAPRYRWIFYPWPVVLVNERRPGDGGVLVRIDYDDGGIVRQYDTTTTTGPVIHGAVPAQVDRTLPDLRQRKPVAFRTSE